MVFPQQEDPDPFRGARIPQVESGLEIPELTNMKKR